jgi:hypothetical protein
VADFVTIANLAASKIGEDDQLRSPDDDNHLSRTVRAVWDLQRRAALRDHSWNFAMRRAQLAAEALETAPIGWQSSFPIPADCVRLIEVLGWALGRDYQREGGAILADSAGPVVIRYIADVEEPALWDDLFVEAFACRIAVQIADRITGDRGRKADAWDGYRAALKEAKRVDARENPQVAWGPTEWELSRSGYGGSRPFGLRHDAAGVWRDPVV